MYVHTEMGDAVTPVGIVLNSTVVNEHEILIRFESIVDYEENDSNVKYCVSKQWTFKEILYQQHHMQIHCGKEICVSIHVWVEVR